MYIDYKLCEKFHCLPSQLDNESEEMLNMYLMMMNIEAEETAEKMKKPKKKESPKFRKRM